MAITSFYLLNMFPQMRTYSSSPNNQHPTPRQNMFPQMRTYSSSPNNQYPTPRENIFPRMRTLHHHPTPKQNMFPRMRTLHHHPTINTQHLSQTCSLRCALYHHHPTINTHHPTAMTVIQQISPSNSFANSSSRSRWSSRIGKIPPMKSVTRFPSFVSTTTGNLPLKDML